MRRVFYFDTLRDLKSGETNCTVFWWVGLGIRAFIFEFKLVIESVSFLLFVRLLNLI